jgi:HSP20 family molecular chaperone IbpA
VSDRLGDAFSRFEEKIRAKAYQLSQVRGPGRGDPVADWLEAEAELLEPVDLEVKEQKKNTVVEVKLKGFESDDIEVEVATANFRFTH